MLALVFCAACDARLGPGAHNNGTPDSNGSNVYMDAPAMMGSDASGLGAWSTPAPVPGASSTANAEDDVTMNAAATELIYAVSVAGNKDLYVMTRPTRNDPFGAPAALASFNTAGTEESPRLSPDDLTIYFGRDGNIFSAMRSAVGSPWGPATVVTGSGDTALYEKWLAVCNGNHFMVSRDNGTAQGQDLFEGTLGTAGTVATILNSTKSEISTYLSPDCLTVYFASNRGTQTAIYMSTRTSMAAPWATPTIVGTPFDSGTDNEDAWISTDQRVFVFASVRGAATTKDVYISTR